MRLIALVLAAVPLLNAAPPLPIEWGMTTAAFGGRKAIVKLDSGARIEGVWLGVTPTTFTMDVDQAWGKNPPPKGAQTIERSAIVELRVQERRIRGRVVGAVFGWLVGSPLMLTMSTPAAALAVLASVMTSGHLLGRASDKATRVVHIKPESPSGLLPGDGKAPELPIPPESMGPEGNEGEQES